MNRVLQWLACLLGLGIFMLFTAVTVQAKSTQIAVSQSTTDVAATPQPPTTVPTTATLALDFDLNAVTDEDAIGELEFFAGGGQGKGDVLHLCEDVRDFSFAQPTAIGNRYQERSLKGRQSHLGSNYANLQNAFYMMRYRHGTQAGKACKFVGLPQMSRSKSR
ncbi:MAG: hypothetical protein R2932_46530 [Caldilineaceae bacterium]